MTIYFVGIGGAGLSPMAQLALDCGFEVHGSDMVRSLGTEAVEIRGVPVACDQSGTHIKSVHETTPLDWVVYTAACPPDHPELVYAREQGIKTTKRDGFINYVLEVKNLKLIGVAGTHGKTTTTGMLAWVFQQLDIPVSYLIGSNVSFGPSATYQEGSEYFLLEADEFDYNFLHFTPEYSLVTNIDYDHPDVYASPGDYYQAFAQYCQSTRQNTWLWEEDWAKIESLFEFAQFSNLDKANTRIAERITSIQLPGYHNRCNAYLCAELLRALFGEDVREHLATFPGTQRRMERLSPGLYSDYAHHPTEIKATLQLAREINPHVVVIYQPHQNLRQHEISHLYGDCFDAAEQVYWLPTYLSREQEGLEILTPEYLIERIPNNAHILVAGKVAELTEAIQRHLAAGRMVIAMGAGSIDGAVRQVAAELAASVPLVA